MKNVLIMTGALLFLVQEAWAVNPPRRSYNHRRRISQYATFAYLSMQYTTDRKFGAQVYFPLALGKRGKNRDLGVGFTGRMGLVHQGQQTLVKSDLLVNAGYKLSRGIHILLSPGIQTMVDYEKGVMHHPDHPDIEVPYTHFKSRYTYAAEAGILYELNDWNRNRKTKIPVFLYTGYHLQNGFSFGAGLTF